MRQKNAFLIISILIVIAGCATVDQQALQKKTAEEKADLTRSYYEQGIELEKKGKFVEAGQKYKMALTVNPEDKASIDADQRMTKKLQRIAEIHFRLGRQYQKKGKTRLAELEYLKTLRYDSGHAGALKRLNRQAAYPTTQTKSEFKAGKHIVHVLKSGESLSKLAKKYYGDYKKYTILADYNKLADATHIRVGQTILVPLIDGMPMPAPETLQAQKENASKIQQVAEEAPKDSVSTYQKIEPATSAEEPAEEDVSRPEAPDESGYDDTTIARDDAGQEIQEADTTEKTPGPDSAVADKVAATSVEMAAIDPYADKETIDETMSVIAEEEENAEEKNEPEEDVTTDLVAQYMDKGIILFNNNQFGQAIGEFGKVIEIEPKNPAALEHLSKAHFQQALICFENNDYLAAKKDFEISLEYNPECERCTEYIQKSETTYKEYHYNRGISFLEQEQMAEAIKEWEKVFALDPDYKNVDRNLKKYKVLLKRLEAIKKKESQQ